MARTSASTSTVRLMRIFKIHHCLRTMKAFSAEELAGACRGADPEVNVRKVWEDVQFLRGLGASIPKGNKHTKFRYGKPYSMLEALEGVNTAETDEVIDYLKQLYQKAPKAAFLELDKVFLALENRIRATSYEGDPRLQFEKMEYLGEEYLTALLDFVVRERTIQFDYEPFEKPLASRTVFPVFLKEFNNRWYLIGYDREALTFQNFALDRIKCTPRLSDWEPMVERLPEPSTYFDGMIGVTRVGEPVDVVVRVSEYRANYIRTKRWHSSQQELDAPDGWVDFRWKLVINNELIARILELGDDAEVLEPVEGLRTHIKEILQRAIQRYGE